MPYQFSKGMLVTQAHMSNMCCISSTVPQKLTKK